MRAIPISYRKGRMFGVTNSSTYGYAWTTDDRDAAIRCAKAIRGVAVDLRTGEVVGGHPVAVHYAT